VQAAGESVSRVAGALVELAARVQAGEGEHDYRNLFFGMQANRNAAAVVGDRDRTVAMHADVDVQGLAGQGLVGRVVDDLLDDVGRRVGAGVHARPFAHRLETFEYTEGGFVVVLLHLG